MYEVQPVVEGTELEVGNVVCVMWGGKFLTHVGSIDSEIGIGFALTVRVTATAPHSVSQNIWQSDSPDEGEHLVACIHHAKEETDNSGCFVNEKRENLRLLRPCTVQDIPGWARQRAAGAAADTAANRAAAPPE